MSPSEVEKKLATLEGVEFLKRAVSEAAQASDLSRVQIVLDAIKNSSAVSKAATSTLLKQMVQIVEKEEPNKKNFSSILDSLIAWSEENKRKILNLEFKTKKIELLIDLKNFKESLALIAEISKLLKQNDDKIGLVKLYYLESKVYYNLKNISKAKSSLTLSRSTSTFVYAPPSLQAKIDLQHSIYLSDEKEYKTAASFLMEALEGFSISKEEEKVVQCVRYLVLTKIMENRIEEIPAVLEHKLVKNLDVENDAGVAMLKRISSAVKERNLRKCNEIIKENFDLISEDKFLLSHLVHLCDSLVDSNILKIIEPYSNISIMCIRDSLGLDLGVIENRVRRMVLDGRIRGNIDQETMCINIEKEERVNRKKEVGEILEVLSKGVSAIGR